jgi:type IV pilus assembly protein PilA
MGGRRFAPALFSLAAACGGASSSLPPPPPPIASAPAVVPAPPPKRGPSAELVRLWPFASRPDLVVFVDVAGLRHAATFDLLTRAIGEAVPAAIATVVDSGWWRCGWALWRGARELAVGDGDAGHLFVARFDGAPPMEACESTIGGTPVQVDGASRALQTSVGVVAWQGSALVFGGGALVAAAMTGANSGATLSDLTLETDEQVTARVSVRDPPATARASLLVSDQRLRLAAEGTLPEALASVAETTLAQARASDLVKGNADLARVFQFVTLSRTGDHLQAAFDLAEAPAEQVRDLGLLTTTGIYGVRKYVAQAKTAEARLALREIARLMVDWGAREVGPGAPGKPHARLKLFSLPPVPSEVPHAVKYQSSGADWKAWEKIHFSMGEPQYYQYEVKAAKDGLGADIIARGDLNGDGKASFFRIQAVVDKASGGLLISPNIEEQDPEE